MMRSSSNRSTNRLGSVLTNSFTTSHHRRSMPTIFKSSRSAKKQHSLTLNKADFEICHAPNDDEMLEYMHNSNGQINNNNTNQSELTTSDDTITDQEQQSYETSQTTPNKHHLISQLKYRFASHRNEHKKREEHDPEKNRGFVLIDQVDSDLVLIPNDNNDPQHTRHAEPCEHGQIDDDIVDINHIQLESTTPVTPHLLPPTQSSILPVRNHPNSEFDVQATQAGVECVAPGFDEITTVETTNSSSSTNSSNNDALYNNIDRTILNDTDYVLEQKRDLERITVFEIALNDDRRDYQQDLPQNEHDEMDFNLRYKDIVQKNLKLKEELKRLEDEKSRIHSPWSCEICTYINEPYIKTRKDVCEMCEGPSPLKRHTLTS
jgi:hypothetical protein